MNKIHILGGGTVSHVRNHLALTAPAYGKTARELHSNHSLDSSYQAEAHLHLTKMANSGEGNLETNEDVSKLVDELIADPETKIIYFNVALVDFDGHVMGDYDRTTRSGKYETRLQTSAGNQKLKLYPAEKVVKKIREKRKDIFLVAFKTTCGAEEDEQFLHGLNLLKRSSANLVLANDTKTRVNMIITPEQARYSVTTDRQEVLRDLMRMTIRRSQGTFTRSTIVDGESIDWNSFEVPTSLRTVVNHCKDRGAYRTFNGKSVGHFAYKKDAETFYTSKRKTDYGQLDKVGLVKVVSTGPTSVVAHGSRPSVGGMSQRIIFSEHPETDSIVHFHCKAKDKSQLSVRLQTWNECGSMECGQNTSDGLRLEEEGIKCVYLDKHGPNIVFNSSIDPQKVIDFIEKNFDLSASTDEVDRSVYVFD